MKTTEILKETKPVFIPGIDLQGLIELAIAGLDSVHSKEAYRTGIEQFTTWFQEQPENTITRKVVMRWKSYLYEELGLSLATVNLRLSAIKRLVREAIHDNLIDERIANPILRIKGMSSSGTRAGNWLTLKQAQKLINTPDIRTLKGLRDRAILAVMFGTALRRSEIVNLTFNHIQERDGRWIICDLVGKRNKVRSIPLTDWIMKALNAWIEASGLTEGRLFRRINKSGKIISDRLSGVGINYIVRDLSAKLEYDIAVHDLRRTSAKLAHKAGADLTQIQLVLGHSSVQTTERYLGVELDLENAVSDHINLRIR